MHIVIIGGGIIGLCSAYYLRKEGFDITIIDRGDITDGCSFGNMGYMSPSHFIPLASPGIIAEGFKHMLSCSSPFYIQPRANFDLLKWGYHFLKSCHKNTVKKNAPHLNNILQLSRSLANGLRNDIGDSFDMQEIGCLMMCQKPSLLHHEYHLADEAIKFGLQTEKLDKTQVQSLEPDVEVNVAGAVLFKDDCHFHPGKMMNTLKDWLLSKGVIFQLNTTVTGFEKNGQTISSVITDKGKFTSEYFVVAAGSWIPGLVKMMGFHLLLQPGKGYSHTYDHIDRNIRYPAILVDARCAITPWQNSLRIGGTMELSGFNEKILVKRMKGIYDSAKSFYPGLTIGMPAADKIWFGLRPATPDGLPYIGKPTSYSNVIFAGGHAMLGMSQGTGTGLLVSQLIRGIKTEINMEAFRLDRF
jgi:D-amino-acid dehydrogenase